MVEILQKCLQQYSGVSILRARSVGDEEGDDASSTTTTTTTEASKVFNKLLEIDTDAWDDKIQQELASSDELTTQKLTAEIQKTMVRIQQYICSLLSYCTVQYVTSTNSKLPLSTRESLLL